MSGIGDLGNPLRKFKLVFLGEQSGELRLSWSTTDLWIITKMGVVGLAVEMDILLLAGT